jgi:hypothetical protein
MVMAGLRPPTVKVRKEAWIAPYLSVARTAWIPCAVIWDSNTGEFRRVEAPRGFESYREAIAASRRRMARGRGRSRC